MTDEKVKVQFEPGCFDNVDMTQEELDEFIAEIKAMAESGELFENSIMITEDNFHELDEDIQEQIAAMLLGDPNDRIVH